MNEPLAQRLRPKTLADVCGQQHLLAPGLSLIHICNEQVACSNQVSSSNMKDPEKRLVA